MQFYESISKKGLWKTWTQKEGSWYYSSNTVHPTILTKEFEICTSFWNNIVQIRNCDFWWYKSQDFVSATQENSKEIMWHCLFLKMLNDNFLGRYIR